MAAPLTPRERFFSTYRRRQPWSIPDSVIYYMAKNPSSAIVYKKLIKSCKYFFVQKPLLIVKSLTHEYYDSKWNTTLDGQLIDFNNITSNIWVTDKLEARYEDFFGKSSLSSIAPKIYQSDVKELIVRGQTCFLNDVIFLAAKCERVDFDKVTVCDENGIIIGLEKLFEHFPKVEDFEYQFDNNGPMMVTSKTVSGLIKLPNFLKLEFLDLWGLPQSFDINAFYTYTKQNKKTKIYLHFCVGYSDEYGARLQSIIDEILADRNRDYQPPCIDFFTIEEDDYERLLTLYDEF